MRDYAKVAPQFWTGATGRALKARGPEAVIVAMYLMTSPHANMIGLFYLPMIYLAHETGLGLEGASKGLAWACEEGFCTYDDASEHVFVHEAARFQVGEQLKATDNQCKGVANELQKAPKGALRNAFIHRYALDFHIKTESPSEAPCKTLRSQEQEQEQEQEQKQEQEKIKPAAAQPAPPSADPPAGPTPKQRLEAAGVDPIVVRDFLALRRAKKAVLTDTAIDGIEREARKAGLSLGDAVKMCCERSWQSFRADWIGHPAFGAQPSQPVRSRREL